MIQLINGSIFDSKCDLIIIPCNNFGDVAPSIQFDLTTNNLPYPRKLSQAGDVTFLENIGDFSNASVIGYASSVDAFRQVTTKQIIQQIVRKIKDYCQEQSLHKVNIPLLGTGAGGLSAKISYSIIKQEFENISDILLYIYVFSEEMYNELADEKKLLSNKQIKNPRVFISYTGTDIKNRNWVKEFACKLRESGIDARLDIFHLKPGQDLPQWMTNEVIMADKVLLICDKYYAEKADNRNGGVGWETMIIQGDMLSRPEQNKYVAILRDKDIDHSLPVYVKSKYALNWSDESQIDKEFKKLILYLFDCDTVPPIGDIPSYVADSLKQI